MENDDRQRNERQRDGKKNKVARELLIYKTRDGEDGADKQLSGRRTNDLIIIERPFFSIYIYRFDVLLVTSVVFILIFITCLKLSHTFIHLYIHDKR